MDERIIEVATKYGLRKAGNRYAGQCPQCGGSSTTDRFVLFADGGFKCFSCGWVGDAVKWLREIDGLGCKEAHDQLGLGCSSSCQHYSSCREGKLVAKSSRSVEPQAESRKGQVPFVNPRTPAEVWQAWAMDMVAKAQRNLAKEPTVIEWLEHRGVSAEAAQKNRLGWRSHDEQVNRSSIGLSPERDGKHTLWVPGGLVIPVYDRNGNLQQVRIRRTDAARDRFLPRRKYQEVEGSGNEPMVLGPLAGHRGVVVVEAELDAIACSAAHGGVLVVGLRSVANGLPSWLRDLCRQAPIILVALDSDRGKDGKPGAGQKAVRNWLAEFRQAKYWPVPQGKDPGDYVRDHQGDLHAWIEAGLPPVVPTVATAADIATGQPAISQAQATSPDEHHGGEGGEEIVLTLTDGRAVIIAADGHEWLRHAQAKQPVFGGPELERVQTLLATMEGQERADALSLLVDLKEILPGFIARSQAFV